MNFDIIAIKAEYRKNRSNIQKILNTLHSIKKDINMKSTKIIMFSTLQSESTAKQIIKSIKKDNDLKGRVIFAGRFVGCNVKLLSDKKADAFLFIGSGRFHVVMLASSIIANAIKKQKGFTINKKIPKVYTIDLDGRLDTINYSNIIKTKKIKYFKFVNSKKIGIIISLKPGQFNMKAALNIEKKIKKFRKEVYMFVSDNINVNQLQDYNVDLWITSACPGLSLEKNMINIDELNVFLGLLGSK